MEYKDYAFDFKARRNTPLLKAYLKREGYKDVNENEFLPYCFDAKMNSEFGVIKTTILFNFKYEHVIMIVGNMLFNSKYDCSEDIKIINKSLSYTQLSKSFYIDNIYGVDFKIPEEYKLWHENSDETEIGIFKYKYYKNSNDLSLDIMVSTNKDPDYSLNKALGFEKIINGHNGKYHEGKLYDVIDDSPTFMYYAGDDKYVSVSVDDKKLFELIIIPSDKNSVDH